MDSNGVEGNSSSALFGEGDEVAISISDDGRYVAFMSDASNLVSGDTNLFGDIFMRDTVTNITTRVSVGLAGAEGNCWSAWPSISADGRYVAFVSCATNLVSGDVNGRSDVFLRDTLLNTTTLVSKDTSGMQGYTDARYTSISADGRYVAFYDAFPSLGAGIFVRDTMANTLTLVSAALDGGESNGPSYSPFISADGRYVVFYSSASNLVSGDTNGYYDVFLRDIAANTTTRVSVASDGAEGNWASFGQSISADGRYVAFASNSSNLVDGDTNGYSDIFVRDTILNTTTRVSVGLDGVQTDAGSGGTSISGDGRYVAFVSNASNLVSGDTNGTDDTRPTPLMLQHQFLTMGQPLQLMSN